MSEVIKLINILRMFHITKQENSSGMGIIIIGLFIFSALLYAPTLLFEFTFDDYFHIENNPHIRNLNGLFRVFTIPTWPGNLFRPIFLASLSLNYAIAGESPLAYHLTNILIQGLVCVLVFCLCSYLIERTNALLTAFLFAIHPIHVEAVANVSNRSEILATVFILAALIFALKLAEKKQSLAYRLLQMFLILISALLAFLTKESTFCLFLLLPLCLIWRWGLKQGLRLSVIPIALLLIAAIGYFFLRYQALEAIFANSTIYQADELDNPLLVLRPTERIFNAIILLGKYLLLCLLPLQLSADYSYAKLLPFRSWEDLELVSYLFVSLVFCFSLFYGLFCASLNRKKFLYWLLWFLFAFFVTANITFPIGTNFAERLLYLPSLGVCGLIAYGVLQIKTLIIRNLSLFLIVAGYIFQTLSYTSYWRDDISLFGREIEQSSQSARVHYNYGFKLQRQGNLSEAELHYRQALEIYPKYTAAARGIASIFVDKGLHSGAVYWLEHALSLSPNHISSLNLLARIRFNRGELESSSRLFERVLKIDPLDYNALLGLLGIALKKRNFDSARDLQQQLKQIDPNSKELIELSNWLEREEKLDSLKTNNG